MRLITSSISCQWWTCTIIHWNKLSLSSLKYQWLLSGCCLSVFGGHANHGSMLLQFIRYLIAEQSRQGKRHESYSELKKKREEFGWIPECWKGLGTYFFIYRRDHVTLSSSSLFVSWSTYEYCRKDCDNRILLRLASPINNHIQWNLDAEGPKD